MIFYFPQVQSEKLDQIQIERAKLLNEKRATGAQIVLGIGIVIGFYLTYRRIKSHEEHVEIERRGEITERYTKAVEQLSNEHMAIRLGGVYALERIGRDSEGDHPTIREVLTAYIRTKIIETSDTRSAHEPLDTDVAAALTVVGRNPPQRGHRRLSNLRFLSLPYVSFFDGDLASFMFDDCVLTAAVFGDAKIRSSTFLKANLNSASFANSNIEEVDFRSCLLKEANFYKARLVSVNFRGANLTRAQFRQATCRELELRGAVLHRVDFTGADMRGVNFSGAIMTETVLRGTLLSGAILRGAVGLTTEALQEAKTDDTTAVGNLDKKRRDGLAAVIRGHRTSQYF